ncbi:MAG: hypothetical protein ACK50Q_16185 [Labrys sp. (in: a-proteobacteria)]
MSDLELPAGETIEKTRARFAKAAEQAREELPALKAELRKLGADRAEIVRHAILNSRDPDVAAVEKAMAEVRGEIDRREMILSLVGEEDRRLAEGEEQHEKREKLRRMKSLLNKRLDLIAQMATAAINYSKLEREFMTLTAEAWTVMGADSDAPWLSRSGLDTAPALSAIRRLMRANGATWTINEPGVMQNNPDPATVVAEGHMRVILHLEQRLAPKTSTPAEA